MAKDTNTTPTGKRREPGRNRAGNGTPTPGPIVRTDCANLSPLKLRLFLHNAEKVTDPETLADLLEGWTRQEAGRVETRLSDGGRFVNTSDPARLLEAIRATLNDGKYTRTGQRWADLFPGVIARLNDAARLDGPTVYARVLARLSTVEALTDAKRGKPSTGTVCALETEKDATELRRIFADLSGAGFIDGTGPESLADFLRAFDPGATVQGRIIWTREAKSHHLNKLALCDFLKLFGVPAGQLQQYAAAIFGVEVSKSTRSNAAGVSSDYAKLKTIIDGQN